MIQIRTLGTLEFDDPSGCADVDAVLAQPKRTALLLYLVLQRAPGPRARDELMAMFWPDSPAARAANALNQSLHFLRTHLGKDVIVTLGGGVEVNRDRITCDAVRSEELLEEGRLADGLELYNGELLAGFHVSGSRSFERWLDSERRRLAENAVEAALQLARTAADGGNQATAVHRFRQALRWQPYRESLLRELVGALVDSGDRPTALREIRAFTERLESDLGMAPSHDLRALMDKVRDAAAGSASPEPRAPDPVPDEKRGPGTPKPSESASASRAAVGGDLSRASRVPDRIRRAAALWLAAAAVVGMVAGAMYLNGFGSENPAPDPGRILVSSLRPLNGDHDGDGLGRVAAEWAAREIGSSGLLEVISTQTAYRFHETPGDPGSRPVADALLEAAREVGAGYLLDGFFSEDGGRIQLSGRIVRVTTGAIAGTIPTVEVSPASPAPGIEEFGRRAVGSVATVIDARVGSWGAAAGPPPSLLAYRNLVDGLDALGARDNAAALRSFRAAAEEDSLFALPLLWQLIIHQQVLDDVMRADSLVRELEPYRERLTVWEAAMLDYQKAAVHGDRHGAYRAMSAVVAITPEPQWLAVLASEALRLNRVGAALDHLARIPSRADDPSMGWPLMNAGMVRALTTDALHRAGRHREELSVARGGGPPPSGGLRRAELRALAGLGRWEEALGAVRRLSPIVDNSPATRWTLRELARELRTHGAPESSVAEVLGVALAFHRSDPESDRIGLGRTLVLAGQHAEARQIFEEVRAAGVYADVVRGDLALLAAQRGDSLEALAADQAYAAAVTDHDLGWNTQWRARIAAALGNRDRAVALLRDALSQGWSHLLEDHRSPHWKNLRGYPPFERLTALAPDPAPAVTRVSLGDDR